MIGEDALCNSVERAGIGKVKVGFEEDGGDGVEGREFGGGRGGAVWGGCVEEAVPFWGDCAEVGVKVLAFHAGEFGGHDGGEC